MKDVIRDYIIPFIFCSLILFVIEFSTVWIVRRYFPFFPSLPGGGYAWAFNGILSFQMGWWRSQYLGDKKLQARIDMLKSEL